jgi:ATP-dependent DNA helicase RecQ
MKGRERGVESCPSPCWRETGRAGRDGEPSHCLLLSSGADSAKHRYFIDQLDDDGERERALGLLASIEQFSSVPACRRRVLLGYFGENYGDDNCAACDVCTGQFPRIEATREARVLLAAVEETGQRFGAVHLGDVLTGAATMKVRDKGHDQLTCYGTGRNKSKTYWRKLIGALLADGALTHSGDTYPVSKLSLQGQRLSRGEGRFAMLEDQRPEPETVRSRSSTTVAEEPCHPGLFERLRILRKELADAEEVPPYVVFSDRTLRIMAGQLPESLSTFSVIHGVGNAKLEKYGRRFLATIREFVEAHDLDCGASASLSAEELSSYRAPGVAPEKRQ